MINSVRKKILGVEIETHPVVFPVSALLVVTFVVLTASFPRRALMLFNWLQGNVSAMFGWLYVAAMSGFLIFAAYLCFSRFGKIRLGKDDQRPEFSVISWFSMLFSAGMGIGMLFFGVVEPMTHYLSPPVGDAQTLGAAQQAMGITLFHWCLHPWALYALVALSLAYFGFRRDLPLSFRSVFYPVLGERIHGRIGDVIDVLAVIATLFGLATSLGLGAKQVNAGLNYVFGLPQGPMIQVILIACITTMAVVSLVSGLNVGIRRLSEANMFLAGGLLVFLLIAGPSLYLIRSLIENVGTYLQYIPTNSFRTAAYDGGKLSSWFNSWTIFYWGWWIAWSPFVGMFIARVSKGRTIREFLLGVLLVPSGVAIVWMTMFGNTALHQEIYTKIASDPESAEAYYGYEENADEYLVQKTREVKVEGEGGEGPKTHSFPTSLDGKWLVAPDAQGVATPAGVRLQVKEGQLVTSDDVPVEYRRGVLINKNTGGPVRLNSNNRFDGEYASESRKLTLGGFLSNPILNDDATGEQDTTATAMFVMLAQYPLTWLTAIIGTLSVILFFVTSSDSASMVADIIASGGSQDPTLGTRLFWGILEGVLAAVLLVAGGLTALQTGSITIGLPFCLLVILMCFSLHRGLLREVRGELKESDKDESQAA